MPDESCAYADTVLGVVEWQGLRVSELWPREEVEEAPDVLAIIRAGRAAAMRYGLTAYDVAYVDLAAREKPILATFDGAMRKAAERSGIVIFR